MKLPGCTSGPTLCRTSVLCTKLRALCVLALRIRCGSKCGGSEPQTRRIPPRLGGPASAPHSAAGRARGQADSVTPAARPVLSKSRRLTCRTGCRVGYCVSIGKPPFGSRSATSCARHVAAPLVWCLRGYPETFLHCCNEIKQHPCGNETRGDRRERVC